VMFVGGPNTRKDYHIECGEEFFFQLRGNMTLPTIQQGKKKIVHINEGQIFLLRARVPHSPQRPEKGSVGLVIERDRVRAKKEWDCLRFYVSDFDEDEEDETRILWQKWFYCSDLGKQLPPVCKEFAESEEFKTHVPGVSAGKKSPVECDSEVVCADPVSLWPLIERNKKFLAKHKRLDVFTGTQTQVRVLTGPFELRRKFHRQTWLYCLKGDARIAFDYPCDRETQLLSDGDCLVVNEDEQYKVTIASANSLLLTVCMDVTAPLMDMKAPPKKYDHENKKDVPWEMLKKEDPEFYKRELKRGKNENELQHIDADITLDKV